MSPILITWSPLFWSHDHLYSDHMMQVGLWIDAGSRYENEHNNGTAHFLEHMAFKVRVCLDIKTIV